MKHLKIFESFDSYPYKKELQPLLNGEDVILYHGTNRDFDKFDANKERTFRTEQFLGSGVHLTPDINVAIKYANAAINNSLDVSIFDDAKKINIDLYKFMHGLYYKGNSTWTEQRSFVNKYTDGFNGVDLNSVADIVNLIPNSQSQKDYNKSDDQTDDGRDEIFNMFSGSTSALSYYVVEDLKSLGLGDYRPRVLTVSVKSTGSNVVESDNETEIKTSKADIIIAHSVKNLIGDMPEVIIRSTKSIQALTITESDFDI